MFCPPSPGIPVFFIRVLNESFDVSIIEIVSISLLWLSVPYRTRFSYDTHKKLQSWTRMDFLF